MKAIICVMGGVHIISPDPSSAVWVVCQCGGSAVRWENPEAGKLVVATRDKSKVHGFGLNNSLLRSALSAHGQTWEDYRAWHDTATDAPGYVFDKSRAGCWAVVFAIGSTSDTRWASDEESPFK